MNRTGEPPALAKDPSIRQRLISGSAWVLGGKSLAAILGIVVNALLARLLSPQELGAYFILVTLVVSSALVAQLGLDRAVVRFVAESLGTGRPGRARASVAISLRTAAIGAVAVAALVLGAVGRLLAEHLFHSHLVQGAIGLAALWIVALTFQQLLGETFRGFHQFHLATAYEGLFTSTILAGVFGVLWALHGHLTLNHAVLISAGASATTVALGIPFMRLQLRPLGDKRGVVPREVLATAWPLLITNVTLFLLGSQVDVWVLGAFRPQQDVAFYGAAARLVLLVSTPFLIIQSVLPPLVAEMYAQGKKRQLENTLRAAATIAGIPSILVLVVFLLMGHSVLGFVYGPFYRQGAAVLAILGFGRIVSVLTGSCGVALMMTGNQATMMRISIVAGIMSVAGGILLAPHFGAVGVALATSSAFAVQNLLMLFMARRRVGIWTNAQVSPAGFRQVLSDVGR
jgi:O-antigen/teichoic acid export membrane protein